MKNNWRQVYYKYNEFNEKNDETVADDAQNEKNLKYNKVILSQCYMHVLLSYFNSN